MAHAAAKREGSSEIISCPVFRAGYDHECRGRAPRIDSSWSNAERISYERGRQFGAYVIAEEGRHIPLTLGGLPNSRANVLLMVAFRSGDIQ